MTCIFRTWLYMALHIFIPCRFKYLLTSPLYPLTLFRHTHHAKSLTGLISLYLMFLCAFNFSSKCQYPQNFICLFMVVCIKYLINRLGKSIRILHQIYGEILLFLLVLVGAVSKLAFFVLTDII